jgi:hypothetical protein
MKLSVSLSRRDVAYLDTYALARGERSRSAVLHKAVCALRAAGCYGDAWETWAATGETQAWELTVADGLS